MHDLVWQLAGAQNRPHKKIVSERLCQRTVRIEKLQYRITKGARWYELEMTLDASRLTIKKADLPKIATQNKVVSICSSRRRLLHNATHATQRRRRWQHWELGLRPRAEPMNQLLWSNTARLSAERQWEFAEVKNVDAFVATVRVAAGIEMRGVVAIIRASHRCSQETHLAKRAALRNLAGVTGLDKRAVGALWRGCQLKNIIRRLGAPTTADHLFDILAAMAAVASWIGRSVRLFGVLSQSPLLRFGSVEEGRTGLRLALLVSRARIWASKLRTLLAPLAVQLSMR